MGLESADPALSAEEIQSSKAAFEKVLPRLKAIAADKVAVPRTDVMLAALTALGVAAKVNQPQWRSAFGKLPAEHFDPASLDLLEPAARAAIFAYAEASTAQAILSEAKLPEPVATEASELRERMLKVYDYHLGQNPLDAAKLADLRAGHGYADLAVDLERLAVTYRENQELFSRDPSYYAPEDPDRAERLARDIQTLLGAGTTPRQQAQKELLARAWTLLSDTYEQIAKPGRWLFDGRGGELFVSLISAGRRPRRKNKKQATPAAVD